MGGAHRHIGDETGAMRRLALLIVAPLILVTIASVVWLWPTEDVTGQRQSAGTESRGQVTALDSVECPEDLPDDVNGCGTATVRLDDGREIETDLPNFAGAPRLSVGDDVELISDGSGSDEVFGIVDHQRGTGLWLLAAAFALALIAFGRWRGLRALVGLAVTFVVLLYFVVPAILNGDPPLLVAIVGSAAIVLVVLYLTHGFSLASTVAVLGTLASLALAGGLSVLSVAALHLTGVTDDISTAVSTTYGVDAAGLLVAGIIIGSVGVLDDVTVTQTATVSELSLANPGYGTRELYLSASRVGRAHIASVVNTIVLAYAGASLPLLVLTVADNASLAGVVSSQFIAQEIVRSIVATLGLIAAVPITTILASALVTRAR